MKADPLQARERGRRRSAQERVDKHRQIDATWTVTPKDR